MKGDIRLLNPAGETLLLLSRQVRLCKTNYASRESTDEQFKSLDELVNARTMLTTYATECLATEFHMHDEGQSLDRDVAEKFDDLSSAIGRYIRPGSENNDHRRALITRAEPFACFSPRYKGNNWSDDNEEIADALNEEPALRALPKALLNRELGIASMKVPAIHGGPENYISPENARLITDKLGDLHQTLEDASEGTGIFADADLERYIPDITVGQQLAEVRDRLAQRDDPTLRRIRALMQAARMDSSHSQKTNDTFDDGPPRGSLKRRRESTSSELDSDQPPPLKKQHRGLSPVQPAAQISSATGCENSPRSSSVQPGPLSGAALDRPARDDQVSSLRDTRTRNRNASEGR